MTPAFSPTAALAGLALLTSTASLGAFEKSDDRLLVGWPQLAVEETPGAEAQIYAIVSGDSGPVQVLYLIAYNNKGALAPMGAFRCDTEFTVLKTATNGMYDIRCVRQDVFGQKTETTLKMSKTGRYEER